MSTAKISVENQTLLTNAIQTFITSDTASSSGSIVVKNSTGFSGSQILVIGELGNEGTELIKSSSVSGVTVTLGTNTSFPHSSGTPVYIIDYDQVEYSTTTTLTGVKTVLATNNVQVDSENSVYTDSAGSTGYYFTRFKNTILSIFSDYSDAIPTGGYGILTARAIINSSLGMIGKTNSEVLTDEFCFNEINNCQMETLRELKRWSFMQVFDYSLGELAQGTWKVAVPTNLDDQFTNKSIYNFRIGTIEDLRWIDKAKWNEITQSVAHSTLDVAISVGNTTITLDNSSDFSDSGTIWIGENSYYYTANDTTTNILTLDTASTTTNSINEDVFFGATQGTPKYWTIHSSYLWFYPVMGSTYANHDGYLDYYKAPVSITTDSDEIVLPDPTIVQYYLAWKMLLRLQSGRDDSTTQAMFNQYIIRRETLKKKEVLGRTFKLKPQLNQINVNDQLDDKQTRTGSFNTGW